MIIMQILLPLLPLLFFAVQPATVARLQRNLFSRLSLCVKASIGFSNFTSVVLLTDLASYYYYFYRGTVIVYWMACC